MSCSWRSESKHSSSPTEAHQSTHRHPRTTQTFVPLGSTEGQGSATQSGSYIVTVALSDASKLKAQLEMSSKDFSEPSASGSQAVNLT